MLQIFNLALFSPPFETILLHTDIKPFQYSIAISFAFCEMLSEKANRIEVKPQNFKTFLFNQVFSRLFILFLLTAVI